jgi:hypothetical protein
MMPTMALGLRATGFRNEKFPSIMTSVGLHQRIV